MKHSGNLKKMRTELHDPVRYQLQLGADSIPMHELVGKPITLQYTGLIHCKVCGKKTKKAFGEGFCYYHFMKDPANSPCIIRPELCEGHLGGGRDPEWEQIHHVQPHVVYLALTSGVKVGVTRGTQVPTRWIDQGAWKAIRLAETENRYQAGLIEVALKNHMADKTPWQRMLKGEQNESIDLLLRKEQLRDLLPTDLQDSFSDNQEVVEIHYPVQQYPDKVKSQKLDKVPGLSGILEGIRGQYLIFEGGSVFNVRSHTGYEVELTY